MENSLDRVQKCSGEFFSGVDSAAACHYSKANELDHWTSPMPIHRPMPKQKKRRKGQKVKRRLTRFDNVRGLNDYVNSNLLKNTVYSF